MKHSAVSLFLAGAVLLLMAAPVSADLSSITSISPDVGYADGKTVTVTITGVNFTTTEGTVRFMMSGEDNITSSISSWTADTIVCKIRISSSKETGDWDVVVIRGYDDLEIVDDGAFTITDAMTLTSISPVSARANDNSVDFTLAGTGLSDVEEVFLYNEDYDDNLTADDVVVDSSVKISGTFDLTDMDADTYDVCIGDTYGTVVCDPSFTITTDEVGSIDISSNPSGASISVDGTARGTTPVTVDDLVEGSHKVVLQKSGYLEWGKMVTVEAGDTSEVDADLVAVTTVPTPVPTTIPAPAGTSPPATVRTTVKSTLKVPTTWVDITMVTTTEASPVDPAIVIGAACLGIGLVVFRRK